MATIKSDPRLRDEDQQNQLQEGTISGTSGAPTQNIQQAQTAPQSNQQAAPKQPTSPQPRVTQRASQASSAPRSGMATNVQSYIDKNKPAAQGIAQAVTKDVGKQTSQIQQQAQQEQGRVQSQLAANQARIQQAKDYAQQQIQSIMQATPQQTADQQQAQIPVQEDVTNRFQSLLRGDIGATTPQDVNLTPQQQRLQALRGLAGGVGTEQGRRALLTQTFGGDRDYTRGQSALDQLILGGDAAASQALQQGTEGVYDQTQQTLRNIQQQAGRDVAAQRQALSGIGEEIGGMLTGAESGITGDIQSEYQKALAQREALLNPETQAYQQALQGATQQQQALERALAGGQEGFEKYIAEQLAAGNLARRYGSSDWNIQQTGLGDYLAGKTGVGLGREFLGGGFMDDEGRFSGLDLSHHKERQYMRGLAEDLQRQLGLGEESADLYGASAVDRNLAARGLSPLYEALQQQYQGISGKTPEQLLQERLTKGTGYSYEDLAAGRDIGEFELAAPEQIQRINALRRLAGQSDFIDQDTSGYSEAEQLQNLLDRFGTNVPGPRRGV